jgi:hypothetical protein
VVIEPRGLVPPGVAAGLVIAVYEKHPPAVAEVALLLGHTSDDADDEHWRLRLCSRRGFHGEHFGDLWCADNYVALTVGRVR